MPFAKTLIGKTITLEAESSDHHVWKTTIPFRYPLMKQFHLCPQTMNQIGRQPLPLLSLHQIHHCEFAGDEDDFPFSSTSSIYSDHKPCPSKDVRTSQSDLVLRVCGARSAAFLGFIPRYLGVMLVSHWRVPKAPCNINKLATGSPRRFADENKPFPSAPIAIPGANVNRSQNISEDVPNDTDEAEMPKVALDCNRHIISEWMLCGGRNRSLSHSNVNGTLCVAQRQLWGVLPQGTASSSDLASSTTSRVDQSKPNLLTPSMYHPNYSALFGQQNHHHSRIHTFNAIS